MMSKPPKPRLLVGGLLVGLVVPIAAQPAAQSSAQSPRLSTYTMKVELLPALRLVRGTQTITWKNTTATPTDTLRFHLYLNAFRDRDSTFMREAAEKFRGQWRADEFGGVEIKRLELVEAERAHDLTAQLRHVQPDDGNPDDATVLEVPLPAAVAPGRSVKLRTEFEARLPKAYRRTGYLPGDGFFLMHWFPKLGVLEERDQKAVWNCHQFHANSEFFADFSTYDVEITTPESYVVGATGRLVSGPTAAAEGTAVRVFHADDVHDFAWVADPDFARHVDQFGPVSAASDPVATAVAANMQADVSSFDLPETEIVLLLRPEHDTESQRQRHFDAVKCALEFFGLRFGPYPYDTITVVDPGQDAQGHRLGGGMEYPTLITCGTSLFPHGRAPSPEGVTVHEFGHQYWYGLSANNEFEESWLDEGINSYSEGRAQWLTYAEQMWPVRTTAFGLLTVAGVSGRFEEFEFGAELFANAVPSGWLPPFEQVGFRGTLVPDSPLLQLMAAQPTATFAREVSFSDLWNDRSRFLSIDNPDPMVRPGWQYRSRESYVANSYHRPATLLRTLERMVGRDAWWTFLRRFHMAARFAHPTTGDFTRLLAETCGDQAAAFFDAATVADAVFDYGVDSVQPEDGNGSRKMVSIRRFGVLPAEVRVRFRFEGRPEYVYRTVRADSRYPVTVFRFDDDASQTWGRLLEVWVDPPEGRTTAGELFENPGWPAGVHVLDQNLLNNAWRAEADHAPAFYRGVRLLLQTQSRLSFAGLIG